MLEKNIKSALRKKLNDWLESIENDDVRRAAGRDLVVTGGCFTSMMQNEQPKDYDIYFNNRETTIKVAQYYVEKFNQAHSPGTSVDGRSAEAYVLTREAFEYHDEGNSIKILDPELGRILGRGWFSCNNQDEEVTDENYKGMSRMIANLKDDRVKIYINSNGIAGTLPEKTELGADPVDVLSDLDDIPEDAVGGDKKKKYRPVFLSTNAVTLSDGIQLVVRFFGSPEEIHDTFDFVHTKAYYTGVDLNIPKEVYEAVMNKSLVYTGSKYPVCSVIRMRKFIKRGWSINAGQILKMAMQISDLDLTNIDVLEDQLVGVDSLYFMALIDQFRKQREKDNKWELTTGYVTSIIDKIF